MENFKFAIVISTLLLTGCPSNQTVEQNAIKEEGIVRLYQLHYDEDKSKLKATAQFRNGSYSAESVALNHPSHVLVSGEEMHLFHGDAGFDFDGSDYRRTTETNDPDDSYTFQWERMDGKVFSDEVSLQPSLSFNELNDQLSLVNRSKNLVLSTSGSNTNLDMTIRIARSKRDGHWEKFTFSKEEVNGTTVFTIPKDEIRKLWLGPAILNITYTSDATVFGLRDEAPLKVSSSRNVMFDIEIIE